MGGIGKTTLANVLAHDMRDHFDGVLWATLGQEAKPLSWLMGWIQALGDYQFNTTDIQVASVHLRGLLHDKSMLLIVDDAWSSKDVEPFKVGGQGCHLLITTRRAKIAKDLKVELYQLDVMSRDEAITLFSKYLERSLTNGEKSQAELVAQDVGYLPLALELAAARVKHVSWKKLHNELKQEIAQLEILEETDIETVEHDGFGPQNRVEACFNLSLKTLRNVPLTGITTDSVITTVLDAFIWFGVLPEDIEINASMASNLWNTTENTASKFLELLCNNALLKLSSQIQIEDIAWPTYKLHDLLHDIACRKLTNKSSSRLQQAHCELLQRYCDCYLKGQRSGWDRLPNDGYIYNKLLWHMQKAQWLDEIHQLMGEETADNKNAWYTVRERLGQAVGYLGDVALGWELASQECLKQVKANEPIISIELEVRYALITSSLNSLAQNIPPVLLKTLVKKGIWSQVQASTYASKIPKYLNHMEALLTTITLMPKSSKQEGLEQALAIAKGIGDEDSRDIALANIASHFVKVGNVENALDIAKDIENEYSRALALADIVPNLSEVLLKQALAVAKYIKDEYSKATALIPIVSHLSGSLKREVSEQALNVVKDIENEDFRAITLENIAPHLSEVLLEQALAIAKDIRDEDSRVKALASIATHLPEPLKQKVLEQALDIAKNIRDKDSRVKALASIATHLPEPLKQNVLGQALDVVRYIRGEYSRAKALASIATRFAEIGNLEQALATAKDIRDEDSRAIALADIAPHLSEALLKQALDVAKDIKNDGSRAEALASIATHLSGSLKQEVLEQALHVVRYIEDEHSRARTLENIAPHLSEMLLKQALDAAKDIKDEHSRAIALESIAPHLSEALLKQALAIAKDIRDEDSRAIALADMTTYLSGSLKQEVLEHALDIAKDTRDEHSRVEALASIASHLPEPLKQNVLEHALDIAKNIKDENSRVKALASIASYLPEPLKQNVLGHALDIAKNIRGEYSRAKTLVDIVTHLFGSLKQEVLEQALDIAKDIRDEDYRAEALASIAPWFAEIGNLEQALAIAKDIRDEYLRAIALASIAPHSSVSLKQEVLEQALDVVKDIKDEYPRAIALASIAPKFAEIGNLEQALAITKDIRDEYPRAMALADIVPHSSESLKQEVLGQALDVAKDIIGWPFNAKALAIIATRFAEVGNLDQALAIANDIEDERSRAEALAAIAPYLPEALLKQVLLATKCIRHKDYRANILVAIVPHFIKLPLYDLYLIWIETLEFLALRTRKNLMIDLIALLPISTVLGKEQAIKEICSYISDVGRWWP